MNRTLRLRLVLDTKEGLYEAVSSDIFPELGDIVIIQYPDEEVSTVATNDGCISCVFDAAHTCRLKGNNINCMNSDIGLTPIDDLMEGI